MTTKELVDTLNEQKEIRRLNKTIITYLDKSIKVFPLLSSKEKEMKKKTQEHINENDICIDALMNMIDYSKGKYISEQALKEINDAINTYLLSVYLIEEIIHINRNNEKGTIISFSYLKEYVDKHYKKMIYLVTMYGGKKNKLIDEYQKMKAKDLEYVENKYEKRFVFPEPKMKKLVFPKKDEI